MFSHGQNLILCEAGIAHRSGERVNRLPGRRSSSSCFKSCSFDVECPSDGTSVQRIAATSRDGGSHARCEA